MDDSSLISRLSAQAAQKQRSPIREVIENPAPPGEDKAAVPAMDELSPLPRLGEDYVAHARSANHSVPTLYLLLADGDVMSFPYATRVEGPNLEAAGDAMVIVLRFAGITGIEVRLAGRNLDRLLMLLGDQRVRWVRELHPGRDFEGENEPVVSSVAVKRLIEEGEDGGGEDD